MQLCREMKATDSTNDYKTIQVNVTDYISKNYFKIEKKIRSGNKSIFKKFVL